MNKPVIISGEASETDSEDETTGNAPFRTGSAMTKSIQGAVIAGEDSESETELDASICSALSALNELNVENNPKCEKDEQYDSILHHKLKESNGKLRQDLEGFCNNIVGDAFKSLTNIDQQLIKSQLTLQSAVTSLKSLSANSLSIKNKLQSLLSAQFIPSVNINK